MSKRIEKFSSSILDVDSSCYPPTQSHLQQSVVIFHCRSCNDVIPFAAVAAADCWSLSLPLAMSVYQYVCYISKFDGFA